MRRLRRMRHLDDLAAQLCARLRFRAAASARPRLADCNVHRPLPIARLKRRGRQGLWSYFAGSFARSSLKRSAQRITSSMPCFERDRVAPAEFGAQLEAVEHVGGVLAGPLRADLDAILERLAEPLQDHFDQGADRDQLIAGDVIGLAQRAACGAIFERRIRHVASCG